MNIEDNSKDFRPVGILKSIYRDNEDFIPRTLYR